MEINKIIKHLNPKKATGPDKILVNFVKLGANIIDLRQVLITTCQEICFPTRLKWLL